MALLLLLVLISSVSAHCKDNLFPIMSGGKEDEYISCTFYDKHNDFIIVAGNSTSEDYVPSSKSHGFIYALDMEGNWMWGKFGYN